MCKSGSQAQQKKFKEMIFLCNAVSQPPKKKFSTVLNKKRFSTRKNCTEFFLI